MTSHELRLRTPWRRQTTLHIFRQVQRIGERSPVSVRQLSVSLDLEHASVILRVADQNIHRLRVSPDERTRADTRRARIRRRSLLPRHSTEELAVREASRFRRRRRGWAVCAAGAVGHKYTAWLRRLRLRRGAKAARHFEGSWGQRASVHVVLGQRGSRHRWWRRRRRFTVVVSAHGGVKVKAAVVDGAIKVRFEVETFVSSKLFEETCKIKCATGGFLKIDSKLRFL